MQLGLEKGDKDVRIYAGHMAPFFMLQMLNPENKLLLVQGTSDTILSLFNQIYAFFPTQE